MIRLLKNEYSLHHELVANKEEKLAQEAAITPEAALEVGIKYGLAYEGNINDGAVPLGQSIGTIDKIEHVKDIINRVMMDAENNLKSAYQYIK